MVLSSKSNKPNKPDKVKKSNETKNKNHSKGEDSKNKQLTNIASNKANGSSLPRGQWSPVIRPLNHKANKNNPTQSMAEHDKQKEDCVPSKEEPVRIERTSTIVTQESS